MSDRNRAHAEPPVAVEQALRRPEHGEAPPARMRDSPELEKQGVELLLVTDGIAAHERRAPDDAVGEKRAARRREEEALVAAQREEREAVAAVGLDELSHEPPVAHRLRDHVR